MANDSGIILKAGYTKNIKNPVLFNKLVSTPVYSKIGVADITAIKNGENKNIYLKSPAIVDSRLIEKIIETYDSIMEQMSGQQSNYVPCFYYDTNSNDEIVSLYTTYYLSNGYQIYFEKIPAQELIKGLGIETENEYEWLAWIGEEPSDVINSFGKYYKIQQIIGEYNTNSNTNELEFYPYPSAEEPRSHFQTYDSETDHPIFQLEDLFLNGFTIPNDDPEGEDEIVPGFTDCFYIVSGSKAMDLPSEEALANNQIKKGITFKDKFDEYDSKMDTMQESVNEAINNIDLSKYQQTFNSDSSMWYPTYTSSSIAKGDFGYNNSSYYYNRPIRAYEIINAFGYNVSKYSNNSSDWDTTPTSGSSNPVTSNGIYNAIDSAKKDIKKSIEPNINFYSYKEGFISLDFSNTSKWESFIDGMTENYEYSFINSDSSKDNLFKKTKLYIDITNKIVVNEIAFIAEQDSNSDGFIFANIYNFNSSNVKFNITAANSGGMTNGMNVEVTSSGSKTVNSNSVKSFYYSAYMNANNEVVVYGNSAPAEVTSSICVCPIYGIYNNGTEDANSIISLLSRKIGNIYPNAHYRIKNDYDFEELIYEFEQLGSNYYAYQQNEFLTDQYFISNINTRNVGIAMNNTYLSMSAPSKSISSIGKSYIYSMPYQKEFITSFGKLLKQGDTSTGFYFFMTLQNGLYPRIYITPIVEGINITVTNSAYYFNFKGYSSDTSWIPFTLSRKTYEYGKWYMYDNNIYPQAFNEVDISGKTFCVIPSSDVTTNGTYNYDVFKYTDNEETKEVDFTHIFALSEVPTSVKDAIIENQEKIAALESSDLKNKPYDSSAATIQTLQQVITNLQSQINDILNGNLTINATLTTSGYFDIKMPYFKNILKTDVTLTEHQTEGTTDYYTIEYDITPLINLPALSNFEVYKPEIDFNDSTKSYFDETTFEISDSGVSSAREIKLIGKCSVAGYSALQNDSVIFDEVRIYMRAIDNTIEDQSNEGGE